MFLEQYLFNSRVNLIVYHKCFYSIKSSINPVCILVQHFILFTIEYRMVFSMATYQISIVYKHF